MGWVWFCSRENSASDWKDSERCLARSRKKFLTKEAAQKAADAHTERTGHSVQLADIGRRRWSACR